MNKWPIKNENFPLVFEFHVDFVQSKIHVNLLFRLGVLASDGYCRPFDIAATGYTRSEAVCVLFLQKAKDAKRIYSTVLYSKTNCDGKLNISPFFSFENKMLF